MFQLKRPLAVIDTETTGTDTEKDRIVELAVTILYVNGERKSICRKINPEIPIPAAASEVHGITDEMVANELPFRDRAKAFLSLIQDCDLAGFNSNKFDIPLLFNEFQRAGIVWDFSKHLMIDAGNLFKILAPRTLTAAVKHYLERDHTGAHGAEADTIATADVLLAQIEKHSSDEGFPQTLEELALYSNYGKKVVDIAGKFSYTEADEVVFNFGVNIGALAKGFPSYLEWMINKGDFNHDTKRVAREILAGRL